MRIIYLLVQTGKGKESKTYWNRAGVAFDNRDGSINLKLDLFPDLTFQVRDVPQKASDDE